MAVRSLLWMRPPTLQNHTKPYFATTMFDRLFAFRLYGVGNFENCDKKAAVHHREYLPYTR